MKILIFKINIIITPKWQRLRVAFYFGGGDRKRGWFPARQLDGATPTSCHVELREDRRLLKLTGPSAASRPDGLEETP